MTKKIMNINFVFFAFFYKFNLSFFENNIQNLSGIFSCPEFVWFKFIMSGICPDLFVQNLSRIFYVWNLSRFICPEFVQNSSCPEFIQYLSGICPDLSVQNLTRIFILDKYWTNLDKFWTKSNFEYWICVKKLVNFQTISGHAKIFLDIFWTFSMTFSGHLFFIGMGLSVYY
jgi:hypothetical protein